MHSSGHLNTFTKTYTGSGGQLTALLYITNNYNDAPNATSTDDDIYIPCPNGWKIVWANLTLSNINAPNVTIEPNASKENFDLPLGFYAMSFKLTCNAYLDNVSVKLTVVNDDYANFYLYKAINSSGVLKPSDSYQKRVGNVFLPNDTDYWFDVDFGHEPLNISDTFDNTFFIAIEGTGDLIGRWKVIIDDPEPGAGYVYRKVDGVWSIQNYDCKLRVNVSAGEKSPAESASPSEIGLTINGSRVSDISKGKGKWINGSASSVSNGYIFYDVNSTWMSTVSFSYVWNVTYCKDASAETNFAVGYNSDAFWNVTIDATDAFPSTDHGVNHINVTGIPSDWGGLTSMAYNQSGNSWISLDSHPPNDISFRASNGTWIVNCTAPNYVSGIAFQVGGVSVDNATLNDDLNILVTLESIVSGNANLSIYDPSGVLNYTEEKVVNGGSVSFIWDVSNNATETGTYNVTIRFKDSWVAGYGETSLEIVPLQNTSLVVIDYSSSVEYPGPVPITLYYNRSDTGEGLSGASITAYEGSTELTIHNFNDHGNGTYSFDLDFGSDFGVHDVYFNASGLRLYKSNVSATISINYTKVLVSIHLDTPSSVVLGTSLVARAHLWYTTNSSDVVNVEVHFNFSIRFSNGTSSVISRSGFTNNQGWAEASIQVPIDAAELNVTAYYTGTGVVFGAASTANGVSLTAGGIVNPAYFGLVSLMFLMMMQQSQNLMLYLLLGLGFGSVVIAGVTGDRLRKRLAIPTRALASLENIIVDHIPTGITLWAFDFFKMEQDVTLVSGFMSALKSFLGEMKKGGLRKLETEFGTFIREDGEFLTATCITSGNSPREENWIRQRLRSFLSIAEQRHWDELQSWSGNVSTFRESFPPDSGFGD